MDTQGITLSQLPILPNGLQDDDLIEVIRAQPGKPGRYISFYTFAAGNAIGNATTSNVGLFRLATVEQALSMSRTDRAVTPAGLAAVLLDALENRILAGPGTTLEVVDGVLNITAG